MGTTYLIIGCRILREKRVHYVYVQPIGCWWLLDIVGRHDWMAQQVSSLDNDASSWKLLWNTYVAAKIRMFLWRLSKHSLPTEDVRSISTTSPLIILLKSFHLLFFPCLFSLAPSRSSLHLKPCRPSQPHAPVSMLLTHILSLSASTSLVSCVVARRRELSLVH